MKRLVTYRVEVSNDSDYVPRVHTHQPEIVSLLHHLRPVGHLPYV